MGWTVIAGNSEVDMKYSDSYQLSVDSAETTEEPADLVYNILIKSVSRQEPHLQCAVLTDSVVTSSKSNIIIIGD